MNNSAPPAKRVEMIGISHSFGATRVLADVDLSLEPSEIRALVGQNGAGKSTLMKILGGIYPDHEGSVRIDGEAVVLETPREAQRAGIGLIHQELSLIPSLTVAENVMLGIEPGRGIYSGARTKAAVSDVISHIPLLSELPLDAIVSTLSTGLQQRVEIAKALCRNVRVLVMDEPTARLSGPERDDLRKLMNQLAGEGIAIIYISHFLEEVFESCTTVTILRNGRVVDSGAVESFTLSTLTRAMLNAELAQEELDDVRVDRPVSSEVMLEFAGVSGARIHDIDLTVRVGEIVGLAGLVGSGRTRVAKTATGAERVLGGSLRIAGEPVSLSSPRAALAHGIVLIPESRKTEGIIGLLPAWMNMITMAIDRGMSRFGTVSPRAAHRAVDEQFEALEIRPVDPALPAERFSGGNQQKLLLGRVLLASPRLIVADQPTAGVDVGTKAQIHRLIRAAAADGTSVLTASDDLDELLALCDRVVVMRAGRIVSEHPRSQLDRQKLVAIIAGEEPETRR